MLVAKYCTRQCIEKDVGEQTQALVTLPSRIAAVVTRWQQACDSLLSAGRTAWVVRWQEGCWPSFNESVWLHWCPGWYFLPSSLEKKQDNLEHNARTLPSGEISGLQMNWALCSAAGKQLHLWFRGRGEEEGDSVN